MGGVVPGAARGGFAVPAIARISVIIPTHDRPRLLLAALDSLAAQRRPPFEVVVVDDGSGPGTQAALAAWTPPPGLQLRCLRQDNAGPARARNRGAVASRGDALLFMDDDDVMAPEALARLAAALEPAPPRALAMASHALLHWRNGTYVRESPAVAPDACPPADRLAAMVAGHWFVPVHGYLFTRAALAAIGPWEPALSSQEDDEFLLRAALRGVDFVAAPRALVLYRQHPGVRRATPGRPGESVAEGLRKRLRDDLAIRERVFRELRGRGMAVRFRAAFEAWRRRLAERYAPLLPGVDAAEWAVLQWLQEGAARSRVRQRPRGLPPGLPAPRAP